MSSAVPHEQIVYIGSTGGEKGEGIYIYRCGPTGSLQLVDGVRGIHNPSFIAIHPNGRFLYAIDEDRTRSPLPSGVCAFAIDPESGKLAEINRVATQGRGLCHLTVDHEGRFLLAAHYSGGSISVVSIEGDGSLGQVTETIQHEGSSVHPRQKDPHPHSIYTDPVNTYVLVPDLGIDKVMVYRLERDFGRLIPNETPWATLAPGSGPRHMAFHPGGTYAYVINELASTITAFNYDGNDGKLTEFQTVSTLPEGYSGENTTAEIVVHPSGKFLYGSNRGHDSVVICSIEPDSGELTVIGHEPTQGGHPRNFTLDPAGSFLFAANRDSDNVVVFRVDQESGKLEATGDLVHVPRPVCVKVLPRVSK